MKLAHLLLVPVLALVLSASSCQTTTAAYNPFAQCKTAGQCYLATSGTIIASAAAANEIKNSPDTPPAVKDAIRKTAAEAIPVTKKGSEVYALYRHVKADLNTCAPDDGPCKADANQKIANATADVNAWLKEVAPLVNDLLKQGNGDSTP